MLLGQKPFGTESGSDGLGKGLKGLPELPPLQPKLKSNHRGLV